ncbi:hypothetical protein SODALDRAFT_329410 [Sodiomyces alkalinus F11]|uniref:MINDY deubiquitinase domain-containing protein n=1 Tax=Sodiomyces alkalinus (strain CBS 110278 / VKM F-3762 / F11) TaxID=1314773 RepID=A0A3N2PLE6_SODAK|nr:hypothetical protein SODALDRAFT_329410 [Sodiomyces alkalinus F11]ROT35224.1 hypothetical protein SODALDRAFT_329410 [Sodiomyces alkalinus F11]
MVTRKPLPDDANPTITGGSPSQNQPSDSRLNSDSNADANVFRGGHGDSGLVSTSQPSYPPDVPDVLRPGPPNLPSTSSVVPGIPRGEGEDSDVVAWDNAANPALSAPGFNEQSSGPPGPPMPTDSIVTTPAATLGRTETNPFKRKERKDLPHEKSPSTSAGTSNLAPAHPTQAFSFSDVDITPESSSNPWQPIESETQARPPTPPPFPADLGPEPDVDPWQSEQTRQQQQAASAGPLGLALPSLSPELSLPAWDDDALRPAKSSAFPRGDASDLTGQAGNIWDDDFRQDRGKGKEAASWTPPVARVAETAEGGWNSLGDNRPGASLGSSAPPGNLPEQAAPQTAEGERSSLAPALPPRPTTDRPVSRHSPRPVDSKSETYQIKKINWCDYTAKENPRISPILVQSANGPCPLVALVNALTLTTPAELNDTTLVQVLRSREQISLGLLLDAVLDELMSPRRTREDASLPDVGELYEFLKGLHTGMNVNPRFIPSSEVVQAFERTAMTQLDPSKRGDLIPGTFEDTAEMSFYAAFSIPLIHGWLPTKSDPAYGAFERQAASYEDAQNLLFREEELELKLSQPSGDGLTEPEQQLYQDIIAMKAFFQNSATQLTPWGLEVIAKAMKPGMVAILFRNDHFSTLYLHPHSHQLLALVTDAGYTSHAEVVWESLTDINGLNTEYLSGDFRVVGGASQFSDAAGHSTPWYEGQPSSSTEDQGGWTTVGPRGKPAHPSSSQPGLPDATQEDHDLALALQLQEEEDERHRTEEARRQREMLLSEQYIEQQGRPAVRHETGNDGRRRGGRNDGNSSLVSPRTSSSTVATQPVTAVASPTGRRQSAQAPTQQVRPLVPPVIPPRGQPVNRATEDEDDAPPSYEQAQSSTPYVPPVGHPSHPSSLPGAAQSLNQNTGNIPPSVAPAMPPRLLQRPGQSRPVPTGGTAHASGGKDRDCILM